jgi:hypothetical protein
MKKINSTTLFLITFQLFCRCETGFAQSPGWLWAKAATGQGTEEGYSITADTNGSIYIAGFFNSPMMTFDSTIILGTANYDAYIAKYDANGNLGWAKSFGGVQSDFIFSIAADHNGNIFAAGSFTSATINFGLFTLVNSNPGYQDIFILKFDGAGTIIWAKSAGGSDYDEAYSVAPDFNGGAYLSGYFKSTSIIFGTDTLINNGFDDVFVVRYAANGNVSWAKSAGGVYSDVPYGMTSDINGNVCITGGFNSPSVIFGADTLTSNISYDIFLVKYDLNGNELWAKSTGGLNHDYGRSLVTDLNGNIYMTGTFFSPSLTFGASLLTSNGGSDAYLAKYDAAGNALWAKNAGGFSDDYGYGSCISPNGVIFITGSFDSIMTINSITLTVPSNSPDPMFIASYDSSGNLLCASALASGGDDQNAVAADAFGNAYISGDFYNINPFVVGNDTLALTGLENTFTAKFNCSIMLGISNELPVHGPEVFSVYPTPSDGRITVKFTSYDNRDYMLTISDITGREVVHNRVIANDGINLSEVDLSFLEKGIYFLRLNNKNKILEQRIIML